MSANAVMLKPLNNADHERRLAASAARLAQLTHNADAQGVLRAAIDEFGRKIALVSSFGAESAILLHLLAAVDPSIPVIFLDTGKHFEQTHSYRWSLVRDLGLEDLRIVSPQRRATAEEDPNGDLWRRDSDACCDLRKVRPLNEALSGFDAWITGRKRFHGALRAHLPVVEFSAPHVKVNPLARWSQSDIDVYRRTHELPPHPLVEQGFPSIGCWPCTQPAMQDEDSRAGRWRGAGKTECGIHRL